MPAGVVTAVAGRIAEHAGRHALDSVDVVLHGGEPLLAGPGRIAGCATALRAALEPRTAVRLRVQTNGTRLDRAMIDVLAEHRIRIGVSLDGAEGDHDRYRRRADGTGSYRLVRRALTELVSGRHRDLFAGLLCTVDLDSDPIATYEALLAFRPPAVNFLLPHGNWSAPPPRRAAGAAVTPYADWLIAVFDRWYDAPVAETSVLMFDQIVALLLGRDCAADTLGTVPAAVAVVETDGSIELSDMLTTAYPGAGATGLHVDRDGFDAALRLPELVVRQSGLAALAPSCRACPAVRVCGGGLYEHRYRADSGFANPSVYCPDLYRLIQHCGRRLAQDVSAWRAAGQR